MVKEIFHILTISMSYLCYCTTVLQGDIGGNREKSTQDLLVLCLTTACECIIISKKILNAQKSATKQHSYANMLHIKSIFQITN